MFGGMLVMKAASYVFMLLPWFFCGLVIAFVEQEVRAMTFGSLWALSTVLCLGWALFIRRQHRRLARACADEAGARALERRATSVCPVSQADLVKIGNSRRRAAVASAKWCRASGTESMVWKSTGSP